LEGSRDGRKKIGSGEERNCEALTSKTERQRDRDRDRDRREPLRRKLRLNEVNWDPNLIGLVSLGEIKIPDLTSPRSTLPHMHRRKVCEHMVRE
jgi:hypothetical protein